MSVTFVNEGWIEVAISIADVCAFVAQDTPLDREAQDRGTTVYLTHKRMDMLPSLLSGDIASLHGNKDRYAVTVTWLIQINHQDGRPVQPNEDPLVLHSQQGYLLPHLPNQLVLTFLTQHYDPYSFP